PVKTDYCFLIIFSGRFFSKMRQRKACFRTNVEYRIVRIFFDLIVNQCRLECRFFLHASATLKIRKNERIMRKGKVRTFPKKISTVQSPEYPRQTSVWK